MNSFHLHPHVKDSSCYCNACRPLERPCDCIGCRELKPAAKKESTGASRIVLSREAFENDIYAGYVADLAAYDWQSQGHQGPPETVSKEEALALRPDGLYKQVELELLWAGYQIAMNQQERAG